MGLAQARQALGVGFFLPTMVKVGLPLAASRLFIVRVSLADELMMSNVKTPLRLTQLETFTVCAPVPPGKYEMNCPYAPCAFA